MRGLAHSLVPCREPRSARGWRSEGGCDPHELEAKSPFLTCDILQRHLTSALRMWTISGLWSKQVAVAFETKTISRAHKEYSCKVEHKRKQMVETLYQAR